MNKKPIPQTFTHGSNFTQILLSGNIHEPILLMLTNVEPCLKICSKSISRGRNDDEQPPLKLH